MSYYLMQYLGFNRKKAKDLLRLMQTVSPDASVLVFCGNYLPPLKPNNLLTLFQTMPRHLLKLDLHRCGLGLFIGAGLLPQAARAMPHSLTTLNLEANCLGRHPVNELVAFMQALPESLSALHLGHNNFGLLSIGDLILVLQAISMQLTVLDFSSNQLGNRPIDDLVLFCINLPKHLMDLYLGENNLDQLSIADLIQMIEKMPLTLGRLGLQSNKLGRRPVDELVALFQRLHQGLHTIDLRDNGFHRLLVTGFARVLQALPNTMLSLGLANNKLGHNKTNADFVQIIQALTGQLSTVDLSGNRVSHDQLNASATALSCSNIRTIMYNYHTPDIPAVHAALLANQKRIALNTNGSNLGGLQAMCATVLHKHGFFTQTFTKTSINAPPAEASSSSARFELQALPSLEDIKTAVHCAFMDHYGAQHFWFAQSNVIRERKQIMKPLIRLTHASNKEELGNHLRVLLNVSHKKEGPRAFAQLLTGKLAELIPHIDPSQFQDRNIVDFLLLALSDNLAYEETPPDGVSLQAWQGATACIEYFNKQGLRHADTLEMSPFNNRT